MQGLYISGGEGNCSKRHVAEAGLEGAIAVSSNFYTSGVPDPTGKDSEYACYFLECLVWWQYMSRAAQRRGTWLVPFSRHCRRGAGTTVVTGRGREPCSQEGIEEDPRLEKEEAKTSPDSKIWGTLKQPGCILLSLPSLACSWVLLFSYCLLFSVLLSSLLPFISFSFLPQEKGR